jgi:hypothetical protein
MTPTMPIARTLKRADRSIGQPADGPVAGEAMAGGLIHDVNSVRGTDIPRDRGICSSTPMRVDPHANARRSNDNRTIAPAEKSRASYTAEVRSRKFDFGRTKT